jgi:predicted NACHT family NTPase
MVNRSAIFLSYCSDDVDFSLLLATSLKNAGIPIWMDRLDGGIETGDNWVRTLEEALNNCTALIAVISPSYVESVNCRRELQRVEALRRLVLPVLISEVPTAAWPLEIQERQYGNFRRWRDKDTFLSQVMTLTKNLITKLRLQGVTAPSAEKQYLTSLIADLESKKGVLQYVNLLVHTEAGETSRSNVHDQWADGFSLLEELIQPSSQPQERATRSVSIRDVTKHCPRFVLLGSPGAGKTTVLRNLALSAARRRLRWPRKSRLPIFCRLGAWDRPQSLHEFVRNYSPGSAYLARPLSDEKLILYLDGLNEMGLYQDAATAELVRWMDENKKAEIIITCRVDDYNAEKITLPKFTIARMNNKQISTFCSQYLRRGRHDYFLRCIDSNMSKEQWNKKTETISTRDSLIELTRTPYLLSALIFIFQYDLVQALPKNGGKLSHRLVNALWERERVRRVKCWRPIQEMMGSFSQLAFHIVDDDKPIEVDISYALNFIQDQVLITAAYAANIIVDRGGKLEFLHQIMLEYFSSMELRNRFGLLSL